MPKEETTQEVIICDPKDPFSKCYIAPTTTQKTCQETQYFDELTDTCMHLMIYFGSFDELFYVEYVKGDAEQFTITRRTLDSQVTKKLVSVSDREIIMRLEFANPLEVTANDFIKITTKFGAFNPGITSSEHKISCPRQILNSTSTQVIDSISKASQIAVVAASVGTALLQTLMKASLSQLWGMINGIQFIIHIPCINLDFPANSFLVLKQLIAVATFELPYVNLEDALKGKWKVHEEQVLMDMPPNVVSSMEQLGYNDPNISNTMGTSYVIILATIIGLLMILITLPIKRLKCGKKFNKWLRSKLLWNFVIRLLLEESLEISYAVALTFKYSRFSKSMYGSAIDYFLAVILTASVASLPFFLVIFYQRKYDNWENEKFLDRYGAPLEGLKKDQRSSLFFPIYFVIRRVMFCLTTLYLHDEVILQLLIHQIMTMVSITYLTNFQPKEELLEYRLELMNECFTVLVSDLCLLFTNLDPDRKRQYNWGFVLIAAIVVCVGAHVFFLFKGIIAKLIENVRKARRKGWLKTFKILRKARFILLVLSCRTKLDLKSLRKNVESPSEQSDQADNEEPQIKSLIKDSGNEIDQIPQPVLLSPPADRKQHQDLSVSSLDEEWDSQRVILVQPHLMVIEDEELNQVDNSNKQKDENLAALSKRGASLAVKILSSRGPKALAALEEVVDVSKSQDMQQIVASTAEAANGVSSETENSELRDAVAGNVSSAEIVECQIEQQINSVSIVQCILNLNDEIGVDDFEDIK